MCGAARRCTTVLQSIDHYGKGRDNRLRRPLRRVAGSGSLPTRRGEIPGRPFPPKECGDTAVPEHLPVVCGRVLILPSIHLGRGLGCIVPSPGPHHRSWRSPGEVEKLPRLNPVGASCHSGAGSSRRLASLSRLAIGNERRTEGHNASRFAPEREMIRCCCGGARPSRGRSGAGVSSARSGSTRAASARWSHTGREDNEVSVSGDRFEATLVQNRSIPGDLRLKRKRSREPNVALGTTRVRCSLRSCRGFRVGRQKVVRGSIPLTAPV